MHNKVKLLFIFYLLSKCMFNPLIEVIKYLFDLESFLFKNKVNNEENQDIIGLNKNKLIKYVDIYNNEKILGIDEALKILFSFNSFFNNIENQATKIIYKNKKDLRRYIHEWHQNWRKWKIQEDINEQINKYVDYFENKVLSKLSILNETLFEGKNYNKKIISFITRKKFF